MDSRNVERFRIIFTRRVHAFAAAPTAENFNRYRIASLALDAAPRNATRRSRLRNGR
jgi:hypothetical protein